jgi:hypothetical protein
VVKILEKMKSNVGTAEWQNVGKEQIMKELNNCLKVSDQIKLNERTKRSARAAAFKVHQ